MVTLIQCHMNQYSPLTVVEFIRGLVISIQTVVLHRWENILAKCRVPSVTCNHYDDCRRLRVPLIFVFTYITTEERALSPKLICLRKLADTVLNIWFIC